MKVYDRQIYLNKVKPFIGKQLIKVLTGQRRVGKSFLLLQLINEVKSQYPDPNIIHIDKENNEFGFIKNHIDLDGYIKQKSKKGINFVFIDEVQEIAGFQLTLRSLLSAGNYDLYCTGSNAYTLSGDLATLLAGRYIEVRVHSLSFTEYQEFYQLENNQETLNRYLKYGGLPFLIHLPNEEKVIFDYLKNVYNTIFFKDIVSRFQLKNASFLTDLTLFIAETCGSLFSARKISQYLKSQQIKTTPEVIINYLWYLENAFFIHRVKRSDIEGKKHFDIGEKLYFDDLGLRHSIIGYRQADIGKIMENIVFLHLKIQEWEITVGNSDNKEVDFVAQKNGEKLYVQVAYMVDNEHTAAREFGNLLAIPDNFPKIVVTMENLLAGSSYKGIEHVHLLDFLNRKL
ncbi:MAG: ATP-binding protein [Bacteroidetes bacterium]|nr:MAG: ATP-binding protein [Bacteroidota bacterium]